jgi:exopolysaccharide biosynthesis predicted pyruvyltransferase EpsI
MSLPKNVHVSLSHDTAFYLSKKDFHPSNCAYDLICFRTDVESILSQKAVDKIILQRNGITGFWQSEGEIITEDISKHVDFDSFVKLIEGSGKVITDRAHVAILATILGKDTTLYPNSYYKNKGIYEYSLSCYPNVRFVEVQRNSKEVMATVKPLLPRQGV